MKILGTKVFTLQNGTKVTNIKIDKNDDGKQDAFIRIVTLPGGGKVVAGAIRGKNGVATATHLHVGKKAVVMKTADARGHRSTVALGKVPLPPPKGSR